MTRSLHEARRAASRCSLSGMTKGCLLAVVLGVTGTAHAAEIAEGTVINAGNFEKLKGDTFEGEKLGDLVPESMVYWMREGGLTMKLAKAKPIRLSSKDAEATKKYASQVKYDPATRQISGYVAGTPFPNVDISDPHAGYKLLWNSVLAGVPFRDTIEIDTTTFMISLDKGLERRTRIQVVQANMQGRASVPPVTVEPNEVKRQALVFISPNDVAGLGQYFIRYADGKTDDSWAYIKSIRRPRRLSGGTWMDPIPGLDQLYDDYFCLDGHPSWYPQVKVLGKRKILAVVNQEDPNKPHRTEDRVNIASKPYGAPINHPWEIREVYIIEVIPPKEHPYSRKVFYMDTQAPLNHFAEAYNRKGDFWKIIYMLFAPVTMADGEPGLAIAGNGGVDFRTRHTNYVDESFWRANNPNIKVEDLGVELLTKAASGFGIVEK